LVSFELEVNKLLTHSAITINQFSACVVFAYNVGLANFKASTLLKKININPLDPTIESEFSKWIYANKKVMKGLQTRRMNEYLLFKKK
jgi:lysozyme